MGKSAFERGGKEENVEDGLECGGGRLGEEPKKRIE